MNNEYNENEMTNAEEIFEENHRKAQEMLENPDKVDKLLKRLERKLRGLPKLGDALAYIPKMAMLINSYIKGQYTEVPVGTICAVIGVVAYFVMPVDAIPDFIPAVGLADDAAIAGGALYLVKNDLDEYMDWRRRNGLDEDEGFVYTEAVVE